MEDTLIKLYRRYGKDDYIQALLTKIKRLESKEKTRELKTEIGSLKSEIQHLDFTIKKLKKLIQDTGKKKMLTKIKNQKDHINRLIIEVEKCQT